MPVSSLRSLLTNLEAFDDELTIYAARPWTPDSEAVLAEAPEDGSIAPLPGGFEYFLEIFLAREVAAARPEHAIEAIIYYAENDAYPP